MDAVETGGVSDRPISRKRTRIRMSTLPTAEEYRPSHVVPLMHTSKSEEEEGVRVHGIREVRENLEYIAGRDPKLVERRKLSQKQDESASKTEVPIIQDQFPPESLENSEYGRNTHYGDRTGPQEEYKEPIDSKRSEYITGESLAVLGPSRSVSRGSQTDETRLLESKPGDTNILTQDDNGEPHSVIPREDYVERGSSEFKSQDPSISPQRVSRYNDMTSRSVGIGPQRYSARSPRFNGDRGESGGVLLGRGRYSDMQPELTLTEARKTGRGEFSTIPMGIDESGRPLYSSTSEQPSTRKGRDGQVKHGSSRMQPVVTSRGFDKDGVPLYDRISSAGTGKEGMPIYSSHGSTLARVPSVGGGKEGALLRGNYGIPDPSLISAVTNKGCTPVCKGVVHSQTRLSPMRSDKDRVPQQSSHKSLKVQKPSAGSGKARAPQYSSHKGPQVQESSAGRGKGSLPPYSSNGNRQAHVSPARGGKFAQLRDKLSRTNVDHPISSHKGAHGETGQTTPGACCCKCFKRTNGTVRVEPPSEPKTGDNESNCTISAWIHQCGRFLLRLLCLAPSPARQ